MNKVASTTWFSIVVLCVIILGTFLLTR